jgi:hypothetical protein
MLTRRCALQLAAVAAFTGPTFAQTPPKLFVLGRGVTSKALYTGSNPPKEERSLEGWYVCNGAHASRERDHELFAFLSEKAGRGDGHSTFGIPSRPIEYSNAGEPSRGLAICPSAKLGVVGEALPFAIDSNI